MDIRGQRRSANIEDRRGMSPGAQGRGPQHRRRSCSCVVLSFFGINPLPFLGVATKQPEVEMQHRRSPTRSPRRKRSSASSRP